MTRSTLVYGSTQNVLTGNTIVGQQIRFKEASDNQVHGMTVRTKGGKPSVAYELMSSARNVIADSQVTAPSGYDIRATSGSTGNVFPRFSVTSTLDCSVDASSSVRVSNGSGAGLACGK